MAADARQQISQGIRTAFLNCESETTKATTRRDDLASTTGKVRSDQVCYCGVAYQKAEALTKRCRKKVERSTRLEGVVGVFSYEGVRRWLLKQMILVVRGQAFIGGGWYFAGCNTGSILRVGGTVAIPIVAKNDSLSTSSVMKRSTFHHNEVTIK